ncbi:MAG: leucine-rich repeat protein [Eubacteriales bacterium]
MKRAMSKLILVFAIVSIMTTSAFAASPESDFQFSNGTITKYVGAGGVVQVPSTINGQAVTAIGDEAFYGCLTLTHLVISDGITTIGDSAFALCLSLTNTILNDSITTIGNSAFELCSSLARISIPESVTTIGESAFSSCFQLTQITLPNSLTKVENFMFFGCSALTEVVVGNGALIIGESAFALCLELTKVALPDNLTTIESGAFHGCAKLADINIPSSLTSIGEFSFFNCASQRTIILPNGLATIGEAAFSQCHSLEQINIPDSLSEIPNYTFIGCRSLTELSIPSSVTAIGEDVFFACHSLRNIYYDGTESQWNIINPNNIGGVGVTSNENSEQITFEVAIHFTGTDLVYPTTPIYSAWAETNVIYSNENNLTVGSLGMDYTKSITREQIAELLVNMIEEYVGMSLATADTSTFVDTQNESILKAYSAGIITGKEENRFDPDNTATRQEICIMIYNAIAILEEVTGKNFIDFSQTTLTGFPDVENISTWAFEKVAVLVNNGIMSGSNGLINPTSPTSIQESLVLNNNLFKLGK